MRTSFSIAVLLLAGCDWNLAAPILLRDAQVEDAGLVDGGRPQDAGDSGPLPDSGGSDAGVDSGTDAGPPFDCAPSAGEVSRECVTPVVGCGTIHIPVPSGMFSVGDVALQSNFPADFPARSVTLSTAFDMDVYEVSWARFEQYWADVAGRVPTAGTVIPIGGNSTTWRAEWVDDVKAPGIDAACPNSTSDNASRSALPVNCVNWHTAQAFCMWSGGRLPTSAEREYVARWWPGPGDSLEAPGAQGRLYPGGDAAPTCATVNIQECGHGGPVAVGSYPHTGCLYELAGNVGEWTLDFFAPHDGTCWSGASPLADPFCASTVAPDPNRGTTVGGSWQNDALDPLMTSHRVDIIGDEMFGFGGFRCVYPQP